jgi:hypothetical protein
MSKLVSWEDYQNVRRKLAEYSKFLIYHEPKEDLSDTDINQTYFYGSRPNNVVDIRKNFDNPFYRDIGIMGIGLIKRYFLIEPSTMPKKNIIDSMLGWGMRSSDLLNSLSEKDRKEYDRIIEALSKKLQIGKDYTDFSREM